MPSARSYFNAALYRKHLTRYWPIWAVYTIVWLFILPVNLIINQSASAETAGRFADRMVLQMFPGFGTAMAVMLGLFSAMAIWSYLYNNRAAGLVHTLPIRREGLYFTGFLAGVTFFMVPNLLIFLLTLGAEAMAGAVNPGALLLWLAVQSMLCLFFFCFATLCGFITGHILVLPVFFMVFNFLAIGILALIENAMHNFVYGFAGLTDAYPVAEGLSPLYCIAGRLTTSFIRDENNVITDVVLHGVPTLTAYAAVGLLMAALALLLYRRHQVEKAGEVVTAFWLRPVFKYGVAFCGALAFGTVLFEIFRDTIGYSAWGMLTFLLLCGFLSYLAAEMLLQKSFRVLKKSWKGCAVFLAVLVALTAVMELDLTGYERRVPGEAGVEQVTVSCINAMPYDSGRNISIDASHSALITRVLSLHQSAVQSKQAVEAGLRGYAAGEYTAYSEDTYVESFNRVNFDLTYTLSNGRKLSRSYTIPVTDALLEDPSSPAALLLDLLNNRENIAAGYFPDGIAAGDFIKGSVSFFAGGDGEYAVELSAAQAGILYEAALKDFASGYLGRRYLLSNGEYLTQVYQNRISLTYYGFFPGWTSGTEPDSDSVSFYLQTDSVNLVAALQTIGILDGNHRLATRMEYLQGEKYGY